MAAFTSSSRGRAGLGFATILLSLLAAHCGTAADAASTDESNDTEEARAKECADALEAIPPNAWHAEGRVDPEAQPTVLNAARVCLSRYVQINTSNPARADEPGEVAAVAFFEKVFARLHVPTQRAPLARNTDPKRASLVATMRGTTRDRSIILLNHTDVVRAEGQWKHPPFSGHDDGEFVWGRGAIDMKGVGIIQLVSMAILARAGVPLKRDIHFAATADEETSGTGAEHLALGEMIDETSDRQRDPLGLHPGVVLNEGGTGLRDALLPGRDVYVLGVEEKGCVWTQLAHRDPRALISALAKAAIVPEPSLRSLPSTSTRQDLGSRCKLAAMKSDDEQKTNVQPRHAELVFDCASNTRAVLEGAVSRVLAGFEPAPHAGFTSESANGRERITLKIEMGAGGHGSTAVTTALDVAAGALVASGQIDARTLKNESEAKDRFFAKTVSPANAVFFERIARTYGETASSIPGLLGNKLLLGLAEPFLPTEAPFRNTCSWTTFRYPVAGEARAKIDCRIGYGTKAGSFENDLFAYLAPAGVEKRTGKEDCFDCYRQEFNSSAFGPDAGDYQIVSHVLQRSTPDAIVTPYLFPASSDSYYFRRAGVPTYGVMPAALREPELKTFHGLDERFPIDTLFDAVRVYTETLHKLSHDIAPAPRDAAHKLDTSAIQCQRRVRRGLLSRGYEWKDEALAQPICEASDDTLWRCTTTESAPRFLRGVPVDNDARIYEIVRLKPEYEGSGREDERMPNASFVDKTLYRSRVDREDPSTRVFSGQEFDIDTGTAGKRQFLVRCTTPTHQVFATLLTRSKIDFFRD